MVGRKDRQPNEQRCKSQEPPTLPERRQDSESDFSGRFAHHAIRRGCAHQETISSRTQARVIDRALTCWLAPVFHRAFQFVLVTQRLASAEAEPDEFDLNLIPV